MTTYVITAPDGKEYEVDAPKGATQEDALSYFKSNWKPAEDKKAVVSVPNSSKEPSFMEQLDKGTIASRIKAGTILYPEEEDFIRKTLQGAASGPLSGLVQLGAEAVGAKDVAEKIAQTKREGNIVGSLMQPEAWLGGGKLLQAGKTLGQKMGLFGAYGAGYGAASPSSQTGEEGLKERVETGLTSGAVSGAIPAVGVAVSKLTPTAKNIVNSISATVSKGGRASIGQKIVLDQLPPAERDEVLKILQAQGVDISPFSQLTSAEAIAQQNLGRAVKTDTGAGIAALEQSLSKEPSARAIRGMREQRAGDIEDVFGTLTRGRGIPRQDGLSPEDVARQALEGQRSATAKQLYPKGEVTGDEALNEIMSRPGVRNAMGIEETSAGNVPRTTQIGKDIPARTTYQNVFTEWQQTPYKEDLPAVFAKYPIKSLENQYRLMDKKITTLLKSGESTDEMLARELMTAKKDLGEWLSAASTEWAQANRFFAYQSRPINQSEVATDLLQKYRTSRGQFLGATEDVRAQEALVKSVLGRADTPLSRVFDPKQMSKIEGLRTEAQIYDEVDRLRGMVKPKTEGEKPFQLPNLLNAWVAVANRVLREGGKATVDDITEEAAKILSDPNKFRSLLMKDAAERAKIGKVPMWAAKGGVMAAPATGGMLTGEPQ